MSRLMRQVHRWLSIAFTLGVIVNVTLYTIAGKGPPPPFWVNLLALLPMFALLVTGLYLFALPYLAKSRRVAA